MYELKRHGNERSQETAEKPQNASIEAMHGKESLVHRQQQESENLRNGGHSHITTEFGKPEIIDSGNSAQGNQRGGTVDSVEKEKHRADAEKHEAMEEHGNNHRSDAVIDDKNKAAADQEKQRAMENGPNHGARHEGTGNIALDQDEQKPQTGVVQVLRNPNAEPLHTNDRMTPIASPSRPQWSWDSGDPDAVPPDYVPAGGNRAVPEPLWPESDTLRESTDGWQAQHSQAHSNNQHRRSRFL